MIEVENLEKRYGDVHAVAGISFTVAEGEIFGLLGHNGAGKTTTIRMLTGCTLPTQGSARVAGYDVVRQLDQIKPLINLAFEEPNLYERLSGKENLRFFADVYGVPASRVGDLLNMVDLMPAADRKLKTYSSGMKQRLLVARALINRGCCFSMNLRAAWFRPRRARFANWLHDSVAKGRPSFSPRLIWNRRMNSAIELPFESSQNCCA